MESPILDKFLFFQAVRIDGADQSIMYPLSSFLGFDTATGAFPGDSGDTNATTLNMRFLPLRRGTRINQEDAGAVDDSTDIVKLTVTKNSQHMVMKNITDKLNEPIARTGRFLVIADLMNSDFIDLDITSMAIFVAAATADA